MHTSIGRANLAGVPIASAGFQPLVLRTSLFYTIASAPAGRNMVATGANPWLQLYLRFTRHR